MANKVTRLVIDCYVALSGASDDKLETSNTYIRDPHKMFIDSTTLNRATKVLGLYLTSTLNI